MELARYLAKGDRVLNVGPPATAKTSLYAVAAQQLDADLVISTPGIDDRCDYKGGMFPDHKAGIMRELPLETIHRLLNSTKTTIWFLDDLGNGPMDVQAGIKGLITKGGLLGREKKPNIIVCAATNRPGDKTGVGALHEALRTEFDRCFLMPTPDTQDKPDGGTLFETWPQFTERWVNWALDNEAAPEIIAYHRFTTGSRLYKWKPHADPSVRMPDLRTWHSVIRSWNHNFRSLQDIGSIIGKPDAAEFLAFTNLVKCPSPDQVRMDPDGCEVPENPESLYFCSTMLAQAATKKDAEPFVTFLARMPRIYGALMGRDMYRRLGAALSGSKAWVKWFVENQELFQTGG